MKLTHWILAAALVPGAIACRKDVEDDPDLVVEVEPARGSGNNVRREPPSILPDPDIVSDRSTHRDRSVEVRAPMQRPPSAPPASRSAAGSEEKQVEVTLQPVTPSVPAGPEPLVAKATLVSAGETETRITVEVDNLPQGRYTVRLGSHCARDYGVESNDYPAAAPELSEYATRLGLLKVGANGKGRLISTIPTSPLKPGEDRASVDRRALSVIKPQGNELQPVACGLVTLPEGDWRG